MKPQEQKLVCKLTSPELQKRRATVIRDLKDLVLGKERAAKGYKYSFRSDDVMLDMILSFIKFERLCCDFLLFTLSIEGENAVLHISGPDGSREFLDHELGF